MKNKLMCIIFENPNGERCAVDIKFDKFIGLSHTDGITRLDVLGGISHMFSGVTAYNTYSKLKLLYKAIINEDNLINEIDLGKVVYKRDSGDIHIKHTSM